MKMKGEDRRQASDTYIERMFQVSKYMIIVQIV